MCNALYKIYFRFDYLVQAAAAYQSGMNSCKV